MVVHFLYANAQKEGCAAKLPKEVPDVGSKEGRAELWCKRITGETCWSQILLSGGGELKGGQITDGRTRKVKGGPGKAVNKGGLLTLVVLRTDVIGRVYGIWHYDQTL